MITCCQIPSRSSREGSGHETIVSAMTRHLDHSRILKKGWSHFTLFCICWVKPHIVNSHRLISCYIKQRRTILQCSKGAKQQKWWSKFRDTGLSCDYSAYENNHPLHNSQLTAISWTKNPFAKRICARSNVYTPDPLPSSCKDYRHACYMMLWGSHLAHWCYTNCTNSIQ